MNAAYKKRVLYFFIPTFKHSSAGVKTLYSIIDLCNNYGAESFVLLQNESIGSSRSGFDYNYNAPLLTLEILEKHKNEKNIPILIYPDTIIGNPFNATNVCRMMMYYDGQLSGKSSLDNALSEGIIFFSKLIQQRANIKSALYQQCLCLPLDDIPKTKIYNNDRNIEYYYDGKFTTNLGGTIPHNIKRLKKINRDQNDSLSRSEIFELLSKAKLIHIFEDTALIYEALLLGCPVNIHPNGKFYKGKPLTHNEVYFHGMIFKRDVSQNDIDYAMNQIFRFQEEFEKWKKQGINDLLAFLKKIRLHKEEFTDDTYERIKNNIIESNNFIIQDENELKSGKNYRYSLIKFFIRIIYIVYSKVTKYKYLRYIIRSVVIFLYRSLPTRFKRFIQKCIKSDSYDKP